MRKISVEAGRPGHGLEAVAGGISIHCVDLTEGAAATGLFVQLSDGDGQIRAAGHAGAKGLVEAEGLSDPLTDGIYQADFHVKAYYQARGITLPSTPFLDVVLYRFQSHDSAFHIHLPFKFSPWGYSLFRGN